MAPKRKAADAGAVEAPAPKKGKAAEAAVAAAPAPAPAPVPAAAPVASDAKMVKVIKKGRAPVDPYSGLVATGQVLDENGTVYNCMLNQTNISQNNNKFYVIQVINDGGRYFCFTRWGRVGEPGQNSNQGCSSKEEAISAFKGKFKDKTKNNWENRANFVPQKEKYTLLDMDYGDEEDEPAEKKSTKQTAALALAVGGGSSGALKARTESKLDVRVQALIKMIFDMNMMEATMTQMEYDVKKMPLGKLKKSTILQAYEVLKQLDQAIKDQKGHSTLEQLTSQFYTLVPHSFGRTKPPVLTTNEDIKKKLQMLDALTDIEIATELIASVDADTSGESKLDLNYKKLKCEIVPIDTSSKEYAMIAKYVKNTHENQTPKILEVYRIRREGEEERFTKGGKPLGNRKLLWHGSRLTNFVGIISQGLRIAPPEAPVSGYRFGKGVYFADMMSLSSRYCRASGHGEELCMLLADVALGKCAELARDQFMTKPLAGTDSTFALGTIEPDPNDVGDDEGCTVPFGKVVQNGRKNVSCHENQFVTYDVANCNLKYLLRLKF